jgi:hypothetical protein
MVGWALEPPDDEDLPPRDHDSHDHGGDGDDAAEVDEPAGDEPVAETEPEEVTAGD